MISENTTPPCTCTHVTRSYEESLGIYLEELAQMAAQYAETQASNGTQRITLPVKLDMSIREALKVRSAKGDADGTVEYTEISRPLTSSVGWMLQHAYAAQGEKRYIALLKEVREGLGLVSGPAARRYRPEEVKASKFDDITTRLGYNHDPTKGNAELKELEGLV